MASIDRRPTGAWRVRWVEGGRRVTETFPTEQAALEFKALVELHGRTPPGWVLGVGFDVAGGRTTVREAFDAFVASRASSASAYTLSRYRSAFEAHVLPAWGPLAVDSITMRDVQALVNDRHAAGASAKTVRNLHGVVHGMMQHARRMGWRQDNPCEVTALPKATRRVDVDYLTAPQFSALAQAAHQDVRTMLLVAVGTGLRWGELTALTPSSVVTDQMGTRLRVTRAWKMEPDHSGVMRWELGSPKTTRSFREVYVAGRLADTLQQIASEGGPYLFTAPRGGPWRYPSFHEGRWTPAVDAARKADPSIPDPCRFHFLRHTYAWWSLSAGADLASLQDQMGHESIQMTKDRYGGLNPLARAASAKFSALAVDALPVPLKEIRS